MITKGNQRAGGRELAAHLHDLCENKEVEVLEVRGSVARDASGAFDEWRAQSLGTGCDKYIYSLSVNPDHSQPWSEEQYWEVLGRTETALGLQNQPRVVVRHVKNDRPHVHAAWSRIDTENMKAIHISHDRQKLRRVTIEYAMEKGLELPEGMKRDRGVERFKDKDKRQSLRDKQIEEQTAVSKAQRTREIAESYRQSKGGKEFIEKLANKGYYIAQGDKGLVVVDRHGLTHSLSRQVGGVTAREIKNKVGGYPVSTIPSVKAAQVHSRNVAEHEQIISAYKKDVEVRRERALSAQSKRKQEIDRKEEELRQRQMEEAKTLADMNSSRPAAQMRAAQKPALKSIVGKVTQKKDPYKALEDKHKREQREIERQKSADQRIEQKEARSLKTRENRPAEKVIEYQQKAAEKERGFFSRLFDRFNRSAQPEQKKEQTPEPKQPEQKLQEHTPEQRVTQPEQTKAVEPKQDLAAEYNKQVRPPSKGPGLER